MRRLKAICFILLFAAVGTLQAHSVSVSRAVPSTDEYACIEHQHATPSYRRRRRRRRRQIYRGSACGSLKRSSSMRRLLSGIRGGGGDDTGVDRVDVAEANDEAKSSVTTTAARTTSDIAEVALDALSANSREGKVTDESESTGTATETSSDSPKPTLWDFLQRKRPFLPFSTGPSSSSSQPIPGPSSEDKPATPAPSPSPTAKSIRSAVQKLHQQQKDLTERFKLDLVGDIIQRQSAKAVNAVTAHQPLVLLLHLLSDPKEGFPLTLLGVWLLSIAGCALGFHSFLYFVTVGYGFSVALVSASSLVLFNLCSENPISVLTNLHTALPLLWGLRFMAFLLHREYVNWPQWHEKVAEVNQRAKIESKFWVWSTCGSFYGTMMVPCIYRLRASASQTEVPGAKWGPFGVGAILLQATGLVLEATADFQKSTFKAQEGNRQKWCNKGLWSLSTHPNYLGELIFWVGTYLGGIASFAGIRPWVLSSVGLLFITVVMLMAAESLGMKQMKRYGSDPEFLQFRKTHSLWGPIAF